MLQLGRRLGQRLGLLVRALELLLQLLALPLLELSLRRRRSSCAGRRPTKQRRPISQLERRRHGRYNGPKLSAIASLYTERPEPPTKQRASNQRAPRASLTRLLPSGHNGTLENYTLERRRTQSYLTTQPKETREYEIDALDRDSAYQSR